MYVLSMVWLLAGVEFLITADYKLATSAASFGLPETGLGICLARERILGAAILNRPSAYATAGV